MPVGYLMFDTDWRILQWNDSAAKIFGYSKNEIIGKSLVDYIVPEEAHHLVGDLMDEFLKGNSVHYSEKNNNIRKDKTMISCRWYNTPLANEDGEIFALLSMMEDVTEKLIAEEKLRDSKERLELALTGGDLGAWDYNVTNGEGVFDKGWHGMFGYKEGEIEQNVKGWEKIIHPDDKQEVFDKVQAHIDDPNINLDVEMRLKTKSGNYKWILSKGKVIERDKMENP